MTSRCTGIVITSAFAFALTISSPATSAQTTRASATQPTEPTHPALAALDGEIRQLYRQAESRIVRVHVPVPVPVDDFLARFDPHVRAQMKGGATRLFVRAPGTQSVQVTPESNLIPLPSVNATLNVEFVGLVLTREGDVLLPLFIEPAYAREPLTVNIDDEKATTARVVGADRATALTIVRLAEPAGEVAKFSKARPPLGSLMLMMSLTRRQVRLGVWTGGQDENVIAITREGRVGAIVRNGHPIFPTTFGPIVEQLLTSGVVRRAQLGVQIIAVRPDDPQRVQMKELGARPAARVLDVLADSAAAKAGLKPGDLILSLAGEAVEDIPTFAAAMANKNGPTELLVLRDGQPRKIVVDLKVQ